MKAINYDNNNKLPETVYLNGEIYNGEVSFINGYNGYTETEDDGMMCAIINRSCWTNRVPNLLTDKDGKQIHSRGRRSQSLFF